MPRSKPKPFKYRVRRSLAPALNLGKKVVQIGSQETLTGFIGQKTASDLEERVARAHAKFQVPFDFRVRVTPLAFNMPQKLTQSLAVIPGEVEIDFLSYGAQTYPIFIDGEIAHFATPAQQEADFAKTTAVNDFGKMFGWHEAIRIPFTKLIDQASADNAVRDVFGI